MPDHRRARCRNCKRHRDEAGELSWTGLCTLCSEIRLYENVIGMRTMVGPYAQWWRYRMAASVGFGNLDAAPPQP